jgi:hypothetical protein
MEIGKPERVITVEPLEDPVPRVRPVEAPPVEIPEEEPVPA